MVKASDLSDQAIQTAREAFNYYSKNNKLGRASLADCLRSLNTNPTIDEVNVRVARSLARGP